MHQKDGNSGSELEQLRRWKIFIDKWQNALAEDKECLVLGDVNIDFLKWNLDDTSSSDKTYKQRAMINELFEKIIPMGVSQHVTVPTRVSPNSPPAGLDHVYTNKAEKITDVHAIPNGGSDHKVILVTRHCKSIQKIPRYVRKRCFKNFNTEGFLDCMKNTKWLDIYLAENANEASSLLSAKITEALDIFAPLKTIQVRKLYAQWLTPEAKALMNERNEAQKKAATTNNPEDWTIYKQLRNATTAMTRKCKEEWETKKLDELGNEPREIWQNVKKFMNWKTTGPPTQLAHQGNIINSPNELATTMNDFFINKIKKLEANLPNPSGDPLQYLKKAMQGRTCELKFKPVTQNEVKEIAMSMKNSGSTGLDEINTKIIKLSIDIILPALTQVIKLSLSTTQSFPSSWKVAKIIPLFKKDDPLQPKNYRPVALLPILSKILERVVFKQVVSYLTENNLIHPSHHGSRSGHSTTTAIIEMYDKWIQGVENNEMSAVMMLDLSAAFDLVNHKLLLEKLKLLGFNNEVIKWFKSYLTDRSQVVYIDGKLSNPKQVDIGVPQGSVLGALLYILFTGDIPEVVHGYCTDCIEGKKDTTPSKNRKQGQSEQANYILHCKECGNTTIFVDDSTYTVTNSDPVVISNTLSIQYARLAEYFGNNRLVINHDKTHLVVMGTRRFDKKEEKFLSILAVALFIPLTQRSYSESTFISP